MKELHDVTKSLLDSDGSCRDLNFEGPTWEGVGNLMATLHTIFQCVSITDHEGRTIAIPASAPVAIPDVGHIHVVLDEGTDLLRRLKVFVGREDDGSPFVELTFFPDDLVRGLEVKSRFMKWADDIRALLQARRYYARYENASWRFGDTGAKSGVFLVSDEVGADA